MQSRRKSLCIRIKQVNNSKGEIEKGKRKTLIIQMKKKALYIYISKGEIGCRAKEKVPLYKQKNSHEKKRKKAPYEKEHVSVKKSQG